MDIRIPEVGESVYEALLAKWHKQNGAVVKKDEPLCEIETDKITLDITAEAAGVLTIGVVEGTTVKIGAVIGSLDEKGTAAQPPAASQTQNTASVPPETQKKEAATSPAVRQEMREKGIDPATVTGTGKDGRITPGDLAGKPAQVTKQPPPAPAAKPAAKTEKTAPPAPLKTETVKPGESSASNQTGRDERRPMSPLRKRIAERLLYARQQTAMLTTFNEADLSHIKALREKYKDHFKQRHGVALGFMSFFVKACIEALREFPAVNASIEGDDIVYHHYFDIGIAIGGEKGLVVPILRNADRLHLHEIEQTILDYSEKIKANKLAITDLEGGTFTISNGGVYGSMLSTPIINPPQSAVLGMHNIQERPVVRDGQVVARPMMYLALSYDHRIIDGREAVQFLKRVKEYVEEPEELLLEG